MLSMLYKYSKKYLLVKLALHINDKFILFLCLMNKFSDSKLEIDRLAYFNSISKLSLLN